MVSIFLHASLLLSLLLSPAASDSTPTTCDCDLNDDGSKLFCHNGIVVPNVCVCSNLLQIPQKCSFDDCCRNRRRLTESADEYFNGHEDEVRAYVDRCGKHEYETFLFVDSHLSAIASPKEDAVAAGCPFVVTHAKIDPRNGDAEKELAVWKDSKEGEFEFKDFETRPMGTFKLAELARAFEASHPSQQGQGYDILTNNCANFMVNFASNLGIKVDAGVTSFVARRLLENSGTELLDKIKQSVNYFNFFETRHLRADRLTDEELVQAVVESQAVPLY